MKKIAPIAALALLTLAFTSCKKNYTCECTYANTVLNSSSEIKTTKKDAQDKCDALHAIASPAGGTCKLK